MVIRRLFFFLFVLVFLITTTYLLIQFARGYRVDISQKRFRPTGLLVATSMPDGGQIFVDGKLASATNTTLYLAPDIYEIEIKKDGFHSWKKTIKIEKELVRKTDAWLFPLVSDFRALTFTSASNPLLSPDGSKLVYLVEGDIPEKNGLWVIDLNDLPFGLSHEPKQIVKSTARLDYKTALYQWSADSRQILINPAQGKVEQHFLLDPNSFTPNSELVDITSKLDLIKQQWEQENNIKQQQRLSKLPKELMPLIKEKTTGAHFSPDETKILYTATASAIIPDNLIPPLPSFSSQPQQRQLKPNQTYTYDIKEDRNFFVLDKAWSKTSPFIISWFPNSLHILVVEKDKVSAAEYDGTNWTTLYAGAYQFPFAFPFPSANKLLILTTLSNTPNSSANLYAINLK